MRKNIVLYKRGYYVCVIDVTRKNEYVYKRDINFFDTKQSIIFIEKYRAFYFSYNKKKTKKRVTGGAAEERYTYLFATRARPDKTFALLARVARYFSNSPKKKIYLSIHVNFIFYFKNRDV